MAFGRSASGPGGLSINTGSANSLASPGASQTQPSGSLFGSTSATSQPQQGNGLFGGAKPPDGGLFGSQPSTQQPQVGSLFGSTAPAGGGVSGNTTQQSQAQQASGLFGSSNAQSQPQQAGGLFGSSNAQSQPQQAGGLFGSSSAQSQPQQAGGLFGSSNAQSQPQQAGGLFGSSNAQSQPQQAGGLFGSSVQQPQSQAGGGLFGSSTQQSQPQQSGGVAGSSLFSQSQPQQGGGLFGASNLGQNQNQQQQQQPPQQQPQQQQQAGGPFGSLNQTQNQAQPSGGLFGGLSSNNASTALGGQQNTNTLGGLSFGQSQSQPGVLGQQQTVPGVKIDLANLLMTTRFADLHDDVQAEIEKIDAMIYQQSEAGKQVISFADGHGEKLAFLPNDVNYITHRVATLTSALENDAQAIAYVRQLTEGDGADAKLSFRAVDNLKLPAQYHYHGPLPWVTHEAIGRRTNSVLDVAAGLAKDGDDATSGSKDLVSFFAARADSMAVALQTYEQSIASIESHLRGVEARTLQQMQNLMFTRGRAGSNGNGSTGIGSGDGSAEAQVRELAGVLRDFENGILAVAGVIGGVREGVQELVMRTQGGGELLTVAASGGGSIRAGAGRRGVAM
ncbi:MAG: hypothetical protein M1832_000506 [Thelocarpon impressellum]|nr:MAG: hypothetical protein M1832_000506 [Thelocarpon impressellum]